MSRATECRSPLFPRVLRVVVLEGNLGRRRPELLMDTIRRWTGPESHRLSDNERMQNRVVALEGARSGVALGACAVVLAVLGLTPSLAWIPEAPLLGAASLVPVAILGWTGFRAASRSSRLVAGALAGGLSGAIGGAAGGMMYLAFGKPAFNLMVGLSTGAIGGASIGFLGALGSRRRVGGA